MIKKILFHCSTRKKLVSDVYKSAIAFSEQLGIKIVAPRVKDQTKQIKLIDSGAKLDELKKRLVKID